MKRIILFLFVLVISFFSSINYVNAEEIASSIENNIDNEKKEIKSDEIKKNSKSKSSTEDIFGDEQTFPFVAGLGKNAAH
tara:strand:+ start:218 stop:457 length:240 start_codon:yes stop_codon:yes gene_type:complete